MASPAQPLPPPSIVTTIASALPLPLQTAPPPSSVYMLAKPIPSLSSPTSVAPNQQTPTMVNQVHPSVVSTVFQPTQSAPIIPVTPIPTQNEKRRVNKGNAAGGGGGSSKRAKKNRGGHQTSTKDLGRWKPIDDLALIIGIQQTNDLRMVHRGTKFSCKFTVPEMQSRWYSLLYEESISRIAVAAMRNLHAELAESVQSKALYTTQEEDVLGTIKSVNIFIFTERHEIPTLYFSDRESKQ